MAVTFKDGVILGAFDSTLLSLQAAPLMIKLTPISRRRRLPNHDRRIHRQPSDRQADPRPRHHLVLPVWLRRRHTSRRRHRAIPTGPVPHDERQDTHDPDRRGHVSGALLCEQGHVDVSLTEHTVESLLGQLSADNTNHGTQSLTVPV